MSDFRIPKLRHSSEETLGNTTCRWLSRRWLTEKTWWPGQLSKESSRIDPTDSCISRTIGIRGWGLGQLSARTEYSWCTARTRANSPICWASDRLSKLHRIWLHPRKRKQSLSICRRPSWRRLQRRFSMIHNLSKVCRCGNWTEWSLSDKWWYDQCSFDQADLSERKWWHYRWKWRAVSMVPNNRCKFGEWYRGWWSTKTWPRQWAQVAYSSTVGCRGDCQQPAWLDRSANPSSTTIVRQ